MRIKLHSSGLSHWKGPFSTRHKGVSPTSWPWWRLFKLHRCSAGVSLPCTGYRLWLYTRWGAWCGDVVFDRRPRDRRGNVIVGGYR